MEELLQTLRPYAAFLALFALVLLLAALVLLSVLLAKQKKSRALSEALMEDTRRLLGRADAAARDSVTRPEYYQLSEQLAQRLTQSMDARSQDEALRLTGLQERLEAFGDTQERRLMHVSVTVEDKLTQNELRIEKMRETLEKSVGKLQEENSRKLEEMRQTVDEKLQSSLEKRLSQSFSLVNERLEQVYKGLGEMQTLASGVGDLKKVLTNVKTRGVWGEMQLGALLSQVLSAHQYEENVEVVPHSGQRVEFAVKLPGKEGGPVYLPIDSKFPIEDYERLLAAWETGDTAQVSAAASALESALKTEAKRIASKYIFPPHTTDFAIMFLPIEGLYAEALRMRGLTDELQEKHRIIIAGPTTLNALLTSLQVGFRTLAIEKRTDEVWKLLSAVKTEFSHFGKLLDATQKKMQAAATSIEDATRKTRTIERKLRQVEGLEEGEAAKLLGAEFSPEDNGENEE